MMNLQKILLSIVIGSFSILFSINTWASLTGSFKVSRKSTPSDQRRTVSSGSRSSCQPSVQPKMLELLVPEQKVIHRTSEKKPTFYVYSHTTELIQVDFVLTDLSKTQPIYQKQVTINSIGVKPISLPYKVQLEEKKHYTWNLAIPCQNNRERYQTVLNAGIEYYPNPALTNQISQAKSKREQIQIYAENGIWYEAIELAIEYQKQLGSENHLQTFNTFFNGEQEN